MLRIERQREREGKGGEWPFHLKSLDLEKNVSFVNMIFQIPKTLVPTPSSGFAIVVVDIVLFGVFFGGGKR